jgi:hypothetical protein
MAVARCERCGPPTETKHIYTHAHKLFPFPIVRMVCGKTGCSQPVSTIWLSDEEKKEYLCGQRFFKIARRGEVRVK